MCRAAGLFLALMALVSPTVALTQADPSPYYIDLRLVEHVHCTGGRGSGFRLDTNIVITAHHVADSAPCTVDGRMTNLGYSDPALDIAVLYTLDPSDTYMQISCAVPRSGEVFTALGYAHGDRFIQQKYTGTTRFKNTLGYRGLATFRGLAFKGMSGGPILDGDGRVVAILTAGSSDGLMYGRLLRDTYLCGAKA